MLLSAPGAGTSPSPCLQVLLLLQDALNPVSHPDMCFNISAVSGGGRRQHSPESFPQLSLSCRSCLKGLGSSLGCAGQMGAFMSLHLSGVPQPGSVLTCSLGEQEQPLAGDQRPSWHSWRAELSQTHLQWHRVPVGTEDRELVPLALSLAQQSTGSWFWHEPWSSTGPSSGSPSSDPAQLRCATRPREGPGRVSSEVRLSLTRGTV